MNRSRARVLPITLIVLLAAAGAAAGGESAGTAHAAFDRLKSLEGTWQGTASGGHEGEGEMTITHVFEVSAAGTVVMETMNPDVPDHEMINMYHLDGEDLVLTHYCASGNQPTMKLVRPLAADAASPLPPSGWTMRFDFTGGTNLDPATDVHIHAAHLVVVDADTLESSWTGYQGGQEAGVRTFALKRQ